MLSQSLKLLPTATSHERTQTPRQVDHGRQLANELALLPTPSATEYGNNQSPSPGATVRPSREGLTRLLPTPDAQLATGYMSGTNRDRWRPTLSTLAEEILPDAEWESIGARTRPLSNAGSKSTALRLSPWFVEWMMGAPAGWSDPDCPLSATEFKCSSGGWSDEC